jgi:hypothetical protein
LKQKTTLAQLLTYCQQEKKGGTSWTFCACCAWRTLDSKVTGCGTELSTDWRPCCPSTKWLLCEVWLTTAAAWQRCSAAHALGSWWASGCSHVPKKK